MSFPHVLCLSRIVNYRRGWEVLLLEHVRFPDGPYAVDDVFHLSSERSAVNLLCCSRNFVCTVLLLRYARQAFDATSVGSALDA